VLGLQADRAEEDACRLEHGIGQDVLERLRLLMAYRRRNPGKVVCWNANWAISCPERSPDAAGADP
jgi:Mn-dependent DtxR family transcriptional regulator